MGRFCQFRHVDLVRRILGGVVVGVSLISRVGRHHRAVALTPERQVVAPGEIGEPAITCQLEASLGNSG